jgi:hypothetical protein
MAEEVDPIRTLVAAADKLVEERRALVIAIALGYRRRRSDDGHTNDMREVFISIQNTLEAIDRAIAHEKLIASKQSHSTVASTLDVDFRGASRN